MSNDELSASHLAELIGESLLRIRAQIDRLKISADEGLLFLLLGSLNFRNESGVAVFAPISLDDLFLRFENCPRDRLRQQLKRLQTRQLVKATWHGFVICDPILWRQMGSAIADVSHSSWPARGLKDVQARVERVQALEEELRIELAALVKDFDQRD